jgi:hypothetical protein
MTCAVASLMPGELTLTVDDPLGRVQTFTQSGGNGFFRVWGLHADTDIAWTASVAGSAPVEGTVHTGLVPDDLIGVPTVEDHGGALLDAVLFPYSCGNYGVLAMVDRAGSVIWYENLHDVAPSAAAIEGFSLTDDGFVAVLGHNEIIDMGFDGTVHLVMSYPGELPLNVHHDAIDVDGTIYVITAEEATEADGVTTYVRDGVDTFERDGTPISSWQLAAPFDPSQSNPPLVNYWTGLWPDAVDASHANGLWLRDDGDLIVSLRHLDTVIDLHGVLGPDPQIAWVLGGGVVQPALPSDYTWPAGDGFVLQHNPIWHEDGTLSVLDNRSGGDPSRAIRVKLDDAAMTASVVQEWPLNEPCTVEGSAVPIEDGHVVAACAGLRRITEVDAAGTELWSLVPTCSAFAFGGPVVRGLPIELDGETWP